MNFDSMEKLGNNNMGELASPEELTLKNELIKNLGPEIDSGKFIEQQEFRFDDGRIISIDFGLRSYKFGDANVRKKSKIIVQSENGPDSAQISWGELSNDDKEKILKKIMHKQA